MSQRSSGSPQHAQFFALFPLPEHWQREEEKAEFTLDKEKEGSKYFKVKVVLGAAE